MFYRPMNYIAYFLLILLLAFFLLTGAALQTQSRLSPEEFDAGLKTGKAIQLIDVRTQEEYQEAHIPLALNIDYYMLNFRNKISKLDKTQPVFVYCYKGNRSARAATILAKMGFTMVFELKSGFLAWQKAGLEIKKIN